MIGIKKLRIIIFAIAGGIFGFIVHLVWHFFMGVNLLSVGSHVAQGVMYTFIGAITTAVFYVIIIKR